MRGTQSKLSGPNATDQRHPRCHTPPPPRQGFCAGEQWLEVSMVGTSSSASRPFDARLLEPRRGLYSHRMPPHFGDLHTAGVMWLFDSSSALVKVPVLRRQIYTVLYNTSMAGVFWILHLTWLQNPCFPKQGGENCTGESLLSRKVAKFAPCNILWVGACTSHFKGISRPSKLCNSQKWQKISPSETS